MSDQFSFTVYGTPKPKGSTISFKHAKTGKVITQNACEGLPFWMDVVRTAALQARPDGWPMDRPVHVRAEFAFKRLKKPRVFHVTRPDVDKLLRAILDSLSGVVYADDSQVYELEGRKQYDDSLPTGEGVTVYLRAN